MALPVLAALLFRKPVCVAVGGFDAVSLPRLGCGAVPSWLASPAYARRPLSGDWHDDRGDLRRPSHTRPPRLTRFQVIGVMMGETGFVVEEPDVAIIAKMVW